MLSHSNQLTLNSAEQGIEIINDYVAVHIIAIDPTLVDAAV